jgi:hypothetical protein
MVLVFLLTTFINGEPQPEKSYWYNIDRCQYFARSLRRQNYWLSQKYRQNEIGATCTPVHVNDEVTKVWW